MENFKESSLMYNEQKGDKPWFTKNSNFWILTFLLFGWFQRVKFIENSKKVELNIKKFIHE